MVAGTPKLFWFSTSIESRYDVPCLDRQKEPEIVGLKWDFHFAYSDQGLLYHYTKYVRKSVSMLTGYGGRRAQNWLRPPTGLLCWVKS